MNRGQNMVQFPNGGGIHVPDHILQNREEQRQMIAEMMEAMGRQAYQQTVGAVAAKAREVDRRIGLASAFLSSMMQNGASDIPIKDEVEMAFAFADEFVKQASVLVEKLELEADAEMARLHKEWQEQLQDEQKGAEPPVDETQDERVQADLEAQEAAEPPYPHDLDEADTAAGEVGEGVKG